MRESRLVPFQVMLSFCTHALLDIRTNIRDLFLSCIFFVIGAVLRCQASTAQWKGLFKACIVDSV